MSRQVFWKRETTTKLISLLKLKECLWHPKHPHYTSNQMRKEARTEMLNEIIKTMPDVTPRDVRAKLKTLRSQYAREIRLIERNRRNGVCERQDGLWCFEQLHFWAPYVLRHESKCHFDESSSNTSLPEVLPPADSLNESVVYNDSPTAEEHDEDYLDDVDALETSEYLDDCVTTHEIQKVDPDLPDSSSQDDDEDFTTSNQSTRKCDSESPVEKTVKVKKLQAETRYYNEMASLAQAKRTRVQLECEKLKLEIRGLIQKRPRT